MNHSDQVLGGRYRLDQQLPSADDRHIWTATDEWTEQPVLLVQVPLPDAHDQAAGVRRSIGQQVSAATGLRHPHFNRVLGVVTDDTGQLWVASESRPATRTLPQVHTDTDPIEPARVARWGHDLADGLTALHTAGLTHRALHPGFVCVHDDGSASLAGIATTPDPTEGSDHDLSEHDGPEHDDKAAQRADVHALALLLRATCQDTADRTKRTAAGLVAVLEQATTSSSTSAAELRDQLAAAIPGQPTSVGLQPSPTSPPTPPEPAGPSGPANRERTDDNDADAAARTGAPARGGAAAEPSEAGSQAVAAAAPAAEENTVHITRPGASGQAALLKTPGQRSSVPGTPPLQRSAPPHPASPGRDMRIPGAPVGPYGGSPVMAPGPSAVAPAPARQWRAPGPDADPAGLSPHDPTLRARRGRGRRAWVIGGVAVLVLALLAGIAMVGLVSGTNRSVQPKPPAPAAPAAAPTPPTAPVSAIGDPRSADACSLLPASRFTSFGQVTPLKDYGYYYACWLYVGAGDQTVMVTATFYQAGEYTPGTGTERVGDVAITRYGGQADSCMRLLMLPDGTAAQIKAEPYAKTTRANLCAVADAGTAGAAPVLANRTVGKLSPDPADPLATLEPCSLVDTTVAARTASIDVSRVTPGFGSWSCSVGYNQAFRNAPYFFLTAARRSPLTGTPVRIGQHSAVVVPNAAAPGTRPSCLVSIVQRTFQAGQPRVGTVEVTFYGGGSETSQQTCDAAKALATAAETRLPAPA